MCNPKKPGDRRDVPTAIGRGLPLLRLFVIIAVAKRTNRDHFGLAWSSSEGESEYVIDAISILGMKLARFSPLPAMYSPASPFNYPQFELF